MELPHFPDKLTEIMKCLDTSNKHFIWNIHNTDEKITVTLVWEAEMSKSNFAPKLSKQRKQQVGNTATGSTKPLSRSKKKKSPSRLARDRKRLLDFKIRKKKLQQADSQSHSHPSYRPSTGQEETKKPEDKDVVTVSEGPTSQLEETKDPDCKTPIVKMKLRSQETECNEFCTSGTDELIVDIELPLINSASQLELEVLTKQVQMSCKDGVPVNYKLDISLPYPVDESQGNAKFDKDQHVLTLILPVMSSQMDTTSNCPLAAADDISV